MMLGGDTAYCKWCGTAFTTTREHKVFCSYTCEDAERKAYKAEKAKGETPGNVLEPVIRFAGRAAHHSSPRTKAGGIVRTGAGITKST